MRYFIDVPNDFFNEHDCTGTGADCIMKYANIKYCRFVRNSFAQLTDGSLYIIELADDDSIEFFILRTGFKIADVKAVREYFEKHGYMHEYHECFTLSF